MNFLQIVKLILSMLPAIIEAVKAIEAAMPAGGQGAAKLDAIRGILSSAYAIASDAQAQFDSVWPAISGTVSAVVGMFNRAGAFKTGTGA